MSSNSFLQLIASPFGLGKTRFLIHLAQALASLDLKVLMLCSSNAAVDTMATRLKQVDREEDETWEWFQFHSINTETSSLKQQMPSV